MVEVDRGAWPHVRGARDGEMFARNREAASRRAVSQDGTKPGSGVTNGDERHVRGVRPGTDRVDTEASGGMSGLDGVHA